MKKYLIFINLVEYSKTKKSVLNDFAVNLELEKSENVIN